MILNLGVEDFPYAGHGTTTTVEVAKKLEAKYGVMQAFYDLHQKDIAKFLEESVTNSIDSLLQGAPLSSNPFGDGEQQIEELFKFQFLEQAEMEGLGIPGVPTKASIERRSLRFKSGKGKNKRPSFIDTGLFEKSFKAWIER